MKTNKNLARLLYSLQSKVFYRKLVRLGSVFVKVAELTTADIPQLQRELDISVTESADTVQFVARFSRYLVGYVGISINDAQHCDSCKLFGLFVKNIFRGMGIGELLCRYVLQSAQKSELKNVQLVVGRNNYRAISFYHKLGFRKMEHIEVEEAPIRQDEIIMKKVLK